MTGQHLSILIAEDNEADALLLKRAIKQLFGAELTLVEFDNLLAIKEY